MTVRIVTDSASDLTAAQATALQVTVVPLTVRLGDREFADVEGSQRLAFHRQLTTTTDIPRTAAPAPGAFAKAFTDALASGADAVVCITMSEKLSATVSSARTAAALVNGGPGIHPKIHPAIHVVDSTTVSAGLGCIVKHAARAAANGDDAASIAELVRQLAPTVRIYAMLDTLEHLRRGGRIGGATAVVGTMLSVKPVVTLRAGGIDLAARPRTRRRAMDWMGEQLKSTERAGTPVGDVTVMHTMGPDGDPAPGTTQLVELLAPLVAPEAVEVCAVGAVIASHSGPGMIGVSWRTVPPPPSTPPVG